MSATALERARRALAERRFEAALSAADAALAEQPRDADAFGLRAEVRRRLGDLEGALADLDAALGLEPGEPRFMGTRAELRRRLGDFAGAAADARLLAAARPDDPGGAGALAEALRCGGRLKEALTAAARAVAKDPSSSWPRVVRTKALRALGRDAEALREAARAAAAEPGSYLARAWHAEALRAAGRPAEARAELDAALGLEPSCAWAFLLRAQLRLETGDAAGAEADLDAGLGLDPRASGAYDFLGEGRAGLAGDPRCAWVWAWRGLARQAAGDAAAAEADLSRSAALDPGLAWARARLGELLARSGRARPALTHLDAALALRPQDRRALFWRAEARRARGDSRGALRDLNLLMHIEPLHDAPATRALYGYARVSRAVVLGGLGEKRSALEDLAEGARLLPEQSREQAVAGLAPAERRAVAAMLRGAPARAERDWRLWAEELFARGRGAAARAALRAALRRRPSSAALSLLCWRAQDARGRGGPAELGRLEAARELGLETAEICAWLGRFRLDGGGWPEGLRLLARAAALDPAQAWEHTAWPAGSSAQAADAASARAFTALRKVRARGAEEAVRRYLLSRLAMTLSRLGDARRDLEASRPLFAGCEWFYETVRGEILLKLGRFEDSLSPLERAASLPGAGPRPTFWRAEALFWLGREREAEALSAAAAALAPELAWTHAWRAQMLLWLGRWGEAEAEARRSVELDASGGWAWGWLGAARAFAGRRAEGLADLRRALSLDPSDREARLFLGEFLALEGALGAARRALDGSVARDPGQPWAWALRAWVRGLAGDKAGMLSDYAVAALRPGFLPPQADAARAEDALEALRARARGNRTWRMRA